ncbi:hypothetical protein OQZ33_00435 [Pedobacter sp. MC2016-05]|uniref:hypothetical protein n=1 Tax=Pedobacter sp. MC2016-05 TaxID=2994474 RepID=UPI002246154A|nr:hypothetical protein [Pedobacter sp. MC2016-05]MCX2472785.1 hypothetical protein [Pedobacter sp. MC2016-05]
MHAIVYEVTNTNVPGLVSNFHDGLNLGYAYESNGFYVHFYGTNTNLYSVHTGQTVLEKKSASTFGTIEDWVRHNFGAKNIQTMASNVGESVKGVWRPALYYYADTYQALEVTEADRRLSEQALRVLLEKLDDLFLYIEPDVVSLNTYSHKIRELLILACTEIENFWVHYMMLSGIAPIGRNYSTQDYVKLKEKLFLNEFQFTLRSYATLAPITPFVSWSSVNPTTSLGWYDAYNKTKHNRTTHFSSATLSNAISAVVANLILYIVRFSPYPLLEDKNTFNTLVNQHFNFELTDADYKQSYIPQIEVPAHYRSDIFIYDSRRANDIKPYIVKPFIV